MLGIFIAGMAAFAIPKDFAKKEKFDNIIKTEINHIIDFATAVTIDHIVLDNQATNYILMHNDGLIENEIKLMPTYNLILAEINRDRQYSDLYNNKILFRPIDKSLKPPNRSNSFS